MVKVKEDLTGKRFNMLTVIKQAPDYICPDGRKRSRWYCKCDCGNEDIIVYGSSLKNGNTKSCGCIRTNLIIERNKTDHRKYCEYDLNGEYGIGYTTNNHSKFYFDLEDYEKIKEGAWIKDNKGYIKWTKRIVTEDGIKKKDLLLHRIVMNATDNKDIDHINHNPEDNRKENLRFVTESQNMRNRKIPSNNTSGVKGVCFDKWSNKWVSRITYHNKNYSLGNFDNKEDAIAARKAAEEKYFGEYSYDNSMKIAEENKIAN